MQLRDAYEDRVLALGTLEGQFVWLAGLGLERLVGPFLAGVILDAVMANHETWFGPVEQA